MVAHLLISGFVQGVGFRRFVKHHALKLGITGWVKNLKDNRVEAIFVGSKMQIDKIIKICRKGPFLSEVKDLEINFKDSDDSFNDFKIVR